MAKDIKCVQHDILNAVIAKKTSMRRKLMELNSLANAHQLILLPYQAQLEYMSQVVEERRNFLSQLQDTNEHMQAPDDDDTHKDSDCQDQTTTNDKES